MNVLDDSFGRRIEMDGTCRIGWFKKSGKTLHGYGKHSISEGLFEGDKVVDT